MIIPKFDVEALNTKSKMGSAYLRLAKLDDVTRDEMISSGYGNIRPTDIEKAIRLNSFPPGAEKLWRRRAEITGSMLALQYASQSRFGLHPLDLPGVRDKYYAAYDKRPKMYAKKNPAPKFGRRKSAPAKAAKPAKRAAPKFGKRVTRAPNEKGWLVRAITISEGHFYYVGGNRLTSDKAKAAVYRDHKAAEKVLSDIEDKMPAHVKFVDVVQA